MIAGAETLKGGALDNCMEAVVTEFNAALDAAKAMLNGDATQEDIIAATKRLLDAMAKVDWKDKGTRQSCEWVVDIARTHL